MVNRAQRASSGTRKGLRSSQKDDGTTTNPRRSKDQLKKLEARRSELKDAVVQAMQCSHKENPHRASQRLLETSRMTRDAAGTKGKAPRAAEQLRTATLGIAVAAAAAANLEDCQSTVERELRAEKEFASRGMQEVYVLTETKGLDGTLLKCRMHVTEPGPLVSEEEKANAQEQVHNFDLNDEEPHRTGVDQDALARFVLQDVAKEWQEKKQWEDDAFRRAIYGEIGRHNRVTGGSQESSRNEALWASILACRQQRPWDAIQRAAELAGRLLLIHLDRTEYRDLIRQEGVDPWKFAAQFFGAMYSDMPSIRKKIGRAIKPLYDTHSNLVKKALEYAKACRDRLLIMGSTELTHGPQGLQDAGRGAGIDSQSIRSSRADALVLFYFPWISVLELGMNNSLQEWNTFQAYLKIFGDVYRVFWQRIEVKKKDDGSVCPVPCNILTWDRLTVKCMEQKTANGLRGIINAQEDLQKRYLKEFKNRKPKPRPKGNVETYPRNKPVAGIPNDPPESKSKPKPKKKKKKNGSKQPATVEEPVLRTTRSMNRRERNGRAPETAGTQLDRVGPGLMTDHIAGKRAGGCRHEKRKGSPPDSHSDAQCNPPKRHKPAVAHQAPAAAAVTQEQPVARTTRAATVAAAVAAIASADPTAMEWDTEEDAEPSGDIVDDGETMVEDTDLASEIDTDTGSDDEDVDPSFEVVIVEVVPNEKATTVTAAIPVQDETYDDLKVHKTLDNLLASSKARSKTKLVASFRKKRSGSVYSYSQLSTAPHCTHGPSEVKKVQGAAVQGTNSLECLFLLGDRSYLSEDASFLAPGTDLYAQLGAKDVFANLDMPKILGNCLHGLYNYGKKASMTKQKAKEIMGESRNALQMGFGYAGHGYEKGRLAPPGEFADPLLMNQSALKYYPDNGTCVGELFEALGKIQEALVERLNLPKRSDKKRNDRYAADVGEMLHKGRQCQAGEQIYLVVDVSRSKVFKVVFVRLGDKLCQDLDATYVLIHVDGQNPAPGSPYARTTLATWNVYLKCEGEQCPIQITAILCNRKSICDKLTNNAAVSQFGRIYERGLEKFQNLHGNVRYEDDGLDFFNRADEVTVTYLPNEPFIKNGKIELPGYWAFHQLERSTSARQEKRYKLVQGHTVSDMRFLKSVGNQDLNKTTANVSLKGTSDMADIKMRRDLLSEDRLALSVLILSMRAYVNKLGTICAVRHATKAVVDRWQLKKPHVSGLFFCRTQHFICEPLFVAKCMSLVNDWDDYWSDTPIGQKWLAGCNGDGYDGVLESAFMNMTPPYTLNRTSTKVKRAPQMFNLTNVTYDPSFCANQTRLLRQFAHDVEQDGANRSKSTVSILQSAETEAILKQVVNLGPFLRPQLIVNLFLWGLVDIPCWRASECPILDQKKKHFQEGIQGQRDALKAMEHEELLRAAMDDNDVKSLKSVHRILCINAHIYNTSENTVENGCCESVRPNEIRDFFVVGQLCFNLLPTENSNAYLPFYALWVKEWGANKKWRRVSDGERPHLLRLHYD